MIVNNLESVAARWDGRRVVFSGDKKTMILSCDNCIPGDVDCPRLVNITGKSPLMVKIEDAHSGEHIKSVISFKLDYSADEALIGGTIETIGTQLISSRYICFTERISVNNINVKSPLT